MTTGFGRFRDTPPGLLPKLTLRLRAGLFAVLLVLVTFPDVIFSGATLVNSAGYFAGLYGTPMAALYPERQGRSYHHGFNDSGGAVWQSDPMLRYMGRVLHNRESPYWNRYSATGSLGPETLVDQKFSPITLIAAAQGGTQLAADITLLLFFAFSLYCLYLSVAVNLGLAEGAAVAAGIVYLLGGFNIANLGSNVVHAYVLFPLLLGALMAFVRGPSIARFIMAVGANCLILATTFLPVAFLTFASVYTLAAAYAFGVPDAPGSGPRVRRLLVIGLLVVSFIAALLLMAPLYLPIVESLSLVDSVEMYSNRVFGPVSLRNLIGLISPKHFWESYSAIDAQLLTADPKGPIGLGNGAFHLGIVPIVVATLALTSNWSRKGVVFAAAALLFATALGRIYDVNPIAQVVAQVYGVSSLGCQYWWAMVAITFPFLVAFGFNALLGEDRRAFALVAVYALIFGSFVVAYRAWGWHEGRYLLQISYLTFALVVAAAAAFLITRARSGTTRAWAWRAGLLALMVLELTFYMNHLRPKRNDAALVPPAMLQFLTRNIEDYRLANFGFTGIPPEWGSAHGIAEVGSMTMTILPWYKALFEQAFGLPAGRSWGNFASLHFAADPAKIKDRILDLMAVKYLFIPAPWKEYHDLLLSRGYLSSYSDTYGTLYLNTNVCPRVYLARTWTEQQGVPDDIAGSPCHRVFTDDPKLIASARQLGIPEHTMKDVSDSGGATPGQDLAVSPCHTLFTDDPKLIAAARQLGIAVESRTSGDLQIKGLKLGSDRIRFGVFLDSPGVVVVSDAWHPSWRTTVDKQAVYTGLVNGSFRGITLAAGEHLVEMSYRPRSLPAAIAMAALTLTFLAALIAFEGRVRRRLSSGRA